MGYFDTVKAEKANLHVVSAGNVVPLAVPPVDGLHPYAAAIRGGWLGRLDDLERPWSKGAAWDNGCFVTARKLIELANSPWSGYSVTDAHADYLAHAPRDGVWDKREKCWDQAAQATGATALPPPDPAQPLPDVTLLPSLADLAVEGIAETDTLGDLVRDKLKPLDFVHLLGTDDDGEEWIVEPVIPARRLVALYSAPKVGKSLLMLEMAVGVALGTEVLGVTPGPRAVLYVDFENDPRGDIKRRLEAMGYGREDGARLNERLFYLSFPSIAKLDTPQGGFELLTVAQEYGCELVVIDTVSRAVAGEENDNETWLAFYRNTGVLLKSAGIACLRLDHSGKDVEKGMRGGSAKYGDVDAVWRLTAESETVLNLDCTDRRMPVEHDHLTVVRESEPNLRHRLVGDRTLALSAREMDIDRAIDRLGIDTDVTSANETFKRLKEAGNGFNRQAVMRVVKARKNVLRNAPQGTAPGGSGTTPEPPGTALRVGGSRSPLRSRAPEPPQGTRFPEPEPEPLEASEDAVSPPMFVVACKSCYRPTDRDVAHANGGLCATCFAATGQLPPTAAADTAADAADTEESP